MIIYRVILDKFKTVKEILPFSKTRKKGPVKVGLKIVCLRHTITDRIAVSFTCVLGSLCSLVWGGGGRELKMQTFGMHPIIKNNTLGLISASHFKHKICSLFFVTLLYLHHTGFTQNKSSCNVVKIAKTPGNCQKRRERKQFLNKGDT